MFEVLSLSCGLRECREIDRFALQAMQGMEDLQEDIPELYLSREFPDFSRRQSIRRVKKINFEIRVANPHNDFSRIRGVFPRKRQVWLCLERLTALQHIG